MSDDLVERLRAAGCVFAEDEAAALRAAFSGAPLEAAVARRVAGVPLEQVLGFAEIDGTRIDVGDGVFVPRARAFAIVDAVAGMEPTVAVDLGCGAGTLAALLAQRWPAARVVGTDIDEQALASARRTASRYGFEVRHGSWWDALPAELRGRVDLAVAYLPHVPSDEVERIHPDFRAHEPRRSVDGGPDGLDHWRAVIETAAEWLAPRGVFATLLAPEQVAAARAAAPRWHLDTVPADDDVVLLASPPGR
ncbi:methyltransferase domain-containing protein [Aeromicrobium camelliae]|uniref:Methyltransferase domain-containing protein n=1 Tax=Aeromicrobium camelliae TaxID=1538144 RepID=A0A3N6W656_9ACTN|nr:methyltransferase domain-containing protein [Aeromicrobium camelliae]RQN03009.1 methyltransferase domain-containing protein [Aeromicrobium camelliae]